MVCRDRSRLAITQNCVPDMAGTGEFRYTRQTARRVVRFDPPFAHATRLAAVEGGGSRSAIIAAIMQVAAMHFKARAGEKLADAEAAGRAEQAAGQLRQRPCRAHAASSTISRPCARLRRRYATARSTTSTLYLEEFERNATARGAVVHWAETTAEVNRIVCALAAEVRRKKSGQIEVDGERGMRVERRARSCRCARSSRPISANTSCSSPKSRHRTSSRP